MKNVIVAPSLLAANFLNLENDVDALNKSSCEWLHFDIMDGHFVPNVSYGADIVKAVKKVSNKVFDTHLMMDYPLNYIDSFIEAGSDYITVHFESIQVKQYGLENMLRLIKSKGVKAGVAIQPSTDIISIVNALPYCDLVLIMSVNAGFGGQKFNDNALMKIAILREFVDSIDHEVLISVDGGINSETASLCVDSGVDVVVAGSYIFNGNIIENIAKLK